MTTLERIPGTTTGFSEVSVQVWCVNYKLVLSAKGKSCYMCVYMWCIYMKAHYLCMK